MYGTTLRWQCILHSKFKSNIITDRSSGSINSFTALLETWRGWLFLFRGSYLADNYLYLTRKETLQNSTAIAQVAK